MDTSDIPLCVRWSNHWAGIGWAGLNGAFFVVYVVLGHRMSRDGALEGIERLGVAMTVAMLVVFPIGFGEAHKVFDHPLLLLAAFGVGICSSVIPYTCDQLAMARLPRASFALLLILLPAAATIIGAIVLGQMWKAQDLLGIGLVVIGVGLHRPVPVGPQTRPYNKIIRHQI